MPIFTCLGPRLGDGSGDRGGSVAKNPPAMQEMQEAWVQPLVLEDPLEEAQQPIPIFLPGEFHGQRSLAGHSRSHT